MATPTRTKQFRIFYSWQSDLLTNMGRNFIEAALKKAIKTLETRFPDTEFVIDQDARGESGSVELTPAIRRKIQQADAFVADVSIVRKKSGKHRDFSNPNVIYELGFADRELGLERTILVANTANSKAEALQFDLRGRTLSLYSAAANNPANADTKQRLASTFARALESIHVKPARVKMALTPSEREKAQLKAKDLKSLKAIFESMNTNYMDRFLDDASAGYFPNDIFYFFHDFEGLVSAGSFAIYDSELDGIIGELYRNWSTYLSFGHRFDAISIAPTRYKLTGPLERPIDRESLDAWNEDKRIIDEALIGIAAAYRNLLDYRKRNAPLLDLKKTNKIAFERNRDLINEDRRPAKPQNRKRSRR